MCVLMSVGGYVHMSVDSHKYQKRALGPLEWELQVVWAAWQEYWEPNSGLQ